MKRKTALFLLLLISVSVYSQSKEKLEKLTRQEKKELRKAQGEADFFDAKTALNRQDFVLEANMVIDSKGSSLSVSSHINFISLIDGQFYIQLAPGQSHDPGPNGLGGVTLKSRPTTYELSEDKKGNINLQILASGAAGTYEVFLSLSKGGRYAQATVSTVTGGNKIEYKGHIYSSENSTVYRSGFDF